MPVSNMQCPVCAVPLVMSERQSVEIDYCPQCRGVWLDRGELDKIIERAATEQPSYSPPQQVARPSSQPVYQQHAHQSGPYYKKRRKSFLEELFD